MQHAANFPNAYTQDIYRVRLEKYPLSFSGNISPTTDNFKIKFQASSMFISMQNYKILFNYL